MSEIAERYRKVAEGFAARVAAVPDDRWSSPSPCEGWDARGVVRHLVEAHGMFLGFIGQQLDLTASVDDDPLAAWYETSDAMGAVLDDPATAGQEYDSPFGRQVFEQSANRFVTNDVLLHTWDLARAVGGDEQLDPDEVRTARAAYEELGDGVRSPGVFGPPVSLPSYASEQDQLLAFAGRDPR